MFSDETVENAWMRARSRCECERNGHGHTHPCGKALVWTHRGKPTTLGGWQALMHGDAKLGGWLAVNECEILCWACFIEARAAAEPDRAQDAARQRKHAA